MDFPKELVNYLSSSYDVSYGWIDPVTQKYVTGFGSCHGGSLALGYKNKSYTRFVSFIPKTAEKQEVHLPFWQWLFSEESPYRSVIKHFEWIEDSKGNKVGWSIIPPAEGDSSVFMGLCMASRTPYHNPFNVFLWNHLVQRGWNKTVAFAVTQQSGIDSFGNLKVYYQTCGNAPLDYQNISIIKNLMKAEPANENYTISTGCYKNVTSCWDNDPNIRTYSNSYTFNGLLAQKLTKNTLPTTDNNYFKLRKKNEISGTLTKSVLPPALTLSAYVELAETFLMENGIDYKAKA